MRRRGSLLLNQGRPWGDTKQSGAAPCDSSDSPAGGEEDGWSDDGGEGDGGDLSPVSDDAVPGLGWDERGCTDPQKVAFLVELQELCAAKTGPGGRASHRENGAEILRRFGFAAEAVRRALGACGGNLIAAASNLYEHKVRGDTLARKGDIEGDNENDSSRAVGLATTASPARSPPQPSPRSRFTWHRDRSRPDDLRPLHASLRVPFPALGGRVG